MTKKVYKGTDLQIQLILKDAEGNPYRINKANEFIIKFFTTDRIYWNNRRRRI